MHKQNTLTAREAEKQEVVRDDSLGGTIMHAQVNSAFSFFLTSFTYSLPLFLKKIEIVYKNKSLQER